MSQKLKDIVRQANSSRIKYTYNALVEIRKTYMKNHSVQSLVDVNLVSRLVQLIRTWESLEDGYRTKVVDVAISVLANMCMEECAREKVLKADGVTALGDLFLETDIESLVNRSCRCLANILLSPRSWEPVHKLSILEKLAKVLNETENEDCKQTYIRAVRLLGQTPKHVGLLLENNLVCAVTKHIDAEHSGVNKAAMRCLQSLSCHGCSYQFANQIAKSGKLGYLLTLVQESNHEVFGLVCKLAEHESFRPVFGNEGGIPSFIEYLTSDDPTFTELRIEVLNVLCLCCQDSVNRVKLRENGALQIFLDSLSDDSFKVLHERLVSALVCFLYDEQSFQALLDKGMVDVLRSLFRKYMDSQLDIIPTAENSKDIIVPDILLEDTEETSQEINNVLDSHRKKRENRLAQNEENTMESMHNLSVHVKGEECKQDLPSVEKNYKGKADVHNDLDLLSEECNNSTFNDQDISNEPISENSQTDRAKYSINSPTYESLAKAQQEDYSEGPKCIESFSPSLVPAWNRSGSYSPLCNSSYYSPSESSPEYSPERLSGRGRASRDRRYQTKRSSSEYSPERKLPKYTGLTWSPDSSPERNSNMAPYSKDGAELNGSIAPGFSSSDTQLIKNIQPVSPDLLRRPSETDSVFENEKYQYSPVMENTDVEEEESSTALTDVEKKDAAYIHTYDMQAIENSSPKSSNLSDSCQRNEIQKEEKDITETNTKVVKFKNVVKNKRKHKKQNITFEDNFLILLSRVQVVRPIEYIVSLDMMNCLFDYMTTMNYPLTRVARILSRTFTNKLYFEKMMAMTIPVMIYNKLLRGKTFSFAISELASRRCSSRKSHRSILSEESRDRHSSYERFSAAESPESDLEEQPCKRSKLSHSESSHQEFKASKDFCHVEKCGVAFLDDLASVAETAYGRGVIERILCTRSKELCQDVYMCIPFIIQSIDTRKYYLTQLNILEPLLAVLENEDSQHLDTKQFFTIVDGLNVLGKMSGIKTKYQWPYSNPTRIEDLSESGHHPCMVRRHSDNYDPDIAFIVEGERILVHRDMLTEKSEFFAAMLKGGYKEAYMTEIPLPNTAKFSLEYIIHYIYGCSSECPVIAYLDTAEVSMISLKTCIDLLAEVDKHLLTELKDFVITKKFGRFIIPEGAYLVFEYAVIRENVELLRSAVTCLLAEGSSENIQQLFIKFLRSDNSQIFLHTLGEILTE